MSYQLYFFKRKAGVPYGVRTEFIQKGDDSKLAIIPTAKIVEQMFKPGENAAHSDFVHNGKKVRQLIGQTPAGTKYEVVYSNKYIRISLHDTQQQDYRRVVAIGRQAGLQMHDSQSGHNFSKRVRRVEGSLLTRDIFLFIIRCIILLIGIVSAILIIVGMATYLGSDH